MPHQQRHRGKRPKDAALFAARRLPDLRAAVTDYSLLLTRGYASKSALQLVGNRYNLVTRQRQAVARVACSDQARDQRRAKSRAAESAAGQPVHIDGYNLLITMESALSGGILLACRDGSIRDLAGIHGSYHKVEETLPAVKAIGRHLYRLGADHVHWWLDAPVSNSGRLRALLHDQALAYGWSWVVEIVPNPDRVLQHCPDLIITSDSAILDSDIRWLRFTEGLFAAMDPIPELTNLCPDSEL